MLPRRGRGRARGARGAAPAGGSIRCFSHARGGGGAERTSRRPLLHVHVMPDSNSKRRLVQTFDDGPAGWLRWGTALSVDQVQGGGAFSKLEHSSSSSSSGEPQRDHQEPSCITSRSPWWIDYNHARRKMGM